MLGLAAASPAIAGPAIPGAAFPQISVTPSGRDGVTILAEVVAVADIAAQAELKVVRRGGTGEAVTSQARDIELLAGERTTIARLGLSMAVGDELTISVVIRDHGTEISTATVRTTGKL